MRISGLLFSTPAFVLFSACSVAVGGGNRDADNSSNDGGSSDGGGGAACLTDADCAAHELCGFPESDACSAVGQCFPRPDVTCEAYEAGCACDGTTFNIACSGLPSGYASKPLAHIGACKKD